MPTRVIARNVLSGIVPTGETAATGYENASLTDDQLAKAWRSSSTASSFQLTIDLGTSAPQLSWVGIFDAVAVTTTQSVKQVVVHDAPDAVTYTERCRFDVNGRGDGGRIASIVQRYLRYTIQLTGSSQLDVGLLVAGNAWDLPKQFTRRQQRRDRGVLVNDTEGGGTYAGRLRSYRNILTLDWSALDEFQHDSLMAIEDTTGGEFTPFVLIPDATRPAGLFHGRLEDVQTWTQNPGALYEGHTLAFRESGRAL